MLVSKTLFTQCICNLFFCGAKEMKNEQQATADDQGRASEGLFPPKVAKTFSTEKKTFSPIYCSRSFYFLLAHSPQGSSFCLFVCLSVYLFLWLSVCLCVCLFVCLSVCLSICLFVCLSDYFLSVCLCHLLFKVLTVSYIMPTYMSLLKNHPKYGPTHFLSKLTHNFYRGKKKPLNFSYVCIFEKNCTPPPKKKISPIW
jgi:hypothetical protein